MQNYGTIPSDHSEKHALLALKRSKDEAPLSMISPHDCMSGKNNRMGVNHSYVHMDDSVPASKPWNVTPHCGHRVNRSPNRWDCLRCFCYRRFRFQALTELSWFSLLGFTFLTYILVNIIFTALYFAPCIGHTPSLLEITRYDPYVSTTSDSSRTHSREATTKDVQSLLKDVPPTCTLLGAFSFSVMTISGIGGYDARDFAFPEGSRPYMIFVVTLEAYVNYSIMVIFSAAIVTKASLRTRETWPHRARGGTSHSNTADDVDQPSPWFDFSPLAMLTEHYHGERVALAQIFACPNQDDPEQRAASSNLCPRASPLDFVFRLGRTDLEQGATPLRCSIHATERGYVTVTAELVYTLDDYHSLLCLQSNGNLATSSRVRSANCEHVSVVPLHETAQYPNPHHSEPGVLLPQERFVSRYARLSCYIREVLPSPSESLGRERITAPLVDMSYCSVNTVVCPLDEAFQRSVLGVPAPMWNTVPLPQLVRFHVSCTFENANEQNEGSTTSRSHATRMHTYTYQPQKTGSSPRSNSGSVTKGFFRFLEVGDEMVGSSVIHRDAAVHGEKVPLFKNIPTSSTHCGAKMTSELTSIRTPIWGSITLA